MINWLLLCRFKAKSPFMRIFMFYNDNTAVFNILSAFQVSVDLETDSSDHLLDIFLFRSASRVVNVAVG